MIKGGVILHPAQFSRNHVPSRWRWAVVLDQPGESTLGFTTYGSSVLATRRVWRHGASSWPGVDVLPRTYREDYRVDWDGVGTFALFLSSGAVGLGFIALRAYKAKLASE